VSITENLTVYAQWTANSYRVSFAGNGATSGTMTDQTLRYNTSEKLQANSYARVGYLFAGWAASATGPVLYTDQVGVLNLTAAANATVPLYAKWTQTSYAIEFDSAGGSAVSTRTGIHYGDSISAPAAPSRVGYTFTGWFTDQALTTAMSWTPMPAQNLTLKAGWSINLYSVKYELNGGKNHLSNPAAYTVTSLAVSLGSPTRLAIPSTAGIWMRLLRHWREVSPFRQAVQATGLSMPNGHLFRMCFPMATSLGAATTILSPIRLKKALP
jgi:uncharacterized repeat protein (TIGR02543 family)